MEHSAPEMCIVIILHRLVKGYPVVIGANRDEYYDRGGEVPAIREGTPRILCGTDPRAGGTWLGVNEHGLLVALTDRKGGSPDPRRRSRGLLCLDALRCRSAQDVRSFLDEELAHRGYNPFNLFYTDGSEAFVSHYRSANDKVLTVAVEPGLHALADTELDDASPKLVEARKLLDGCTIGTVEAAVEELKRALAYHGGGGASICEHRDRAGTLSSSIVALGARSIFLHCEGSPCRNQYADLSNTISDWGSAASRANKEEER